MYSVNGVPLDNPVFGWILRAPTEPLSSFTFDRASMERAGRDGVVAGLPATTGPVSLRFIVQTPRANLETLIAVFAAGGVLAVTANTGREVSYETLSHTPTGHGPADAVVDATFLIRLPSVFWRDKTESTTTGALTSASIPVRLFGMAPMPGAVPVARNEAVNPSFEAPGAALVHATNLALNPNAAPAGAAGFRSNNVAVWTVTRQTVGASTNPQGITTRAASAFNGAQNNPFIMNMYDIDGNGNVGPASVAGAWFYVPAGGYEAWLGSSSETVRTPLPGSTWVWVTGTSAANSYMGAYVSKVSGNAGASDIAYITGVTSLVGTVPPKATIAGGVAYPSTAAPDPDLVTAFTATANSSTSTLSGVAPAALSGGIATAFPVQSGAWSSDRAKSLRVVPKGDNAGSYGQLVAAGLTTGKTYTLMVKARLAAIQSGTLHGNARRFYTGFDVNNFATAPNAVGVHDLRIVVTATAASTAVIFYNGSLSTDMWWDDLAIVEGNYTGPAFNGSTPASSSRVYLWDATPDGSASAAWDRSSINGGLSAPVADAVIRVQGAAGGIQIVDSSGAWASLPTVTAGQWVRFECATGRAFITTSDTWTGGTDVSGLVDFGGPRGVFEITPVLTPGDPSTRFGQVTVTTTSRSGASVAVRGRAAYLL
ncbi:hypothetical protein [Microbacterium aurantiacum]|uniref:hypothetical protein n=1 Tax=Microbacterium aurantiacum TaxID=162393 RepID=UPI000C80ED4A|nr:hypothetical protein [Microbacterium aurantiacum]